MNTESQIALIEEGGKVWTTSLEVAEKFGKRHDNVLQKIRCLDCGSEYHLLNFKEISTPDSYGRIQTSYLMTRDGFTYLASRFTGPVAAAWMIKFIEAFNALEQKALELVEQGRSEIRRLDQFFMELSQRLTDAVVATSGTVQEVRADVRDVKFELIDLKTRVRVVEEKTSKRREIPADVKELHRHVFKAIGSRCPCCYQPTEKVEFDHYQSNQWANFQGSWPICPDCHKKLTHQKLSRAETLTRFNAYQDAARMHLPQMSLL